MLVRVQRMRVVYVVIHAVQIYVEEIMHQLYVINYAIFIGFTLQITVLSAKDLLAVPETFLVIFWEELYFPSIICPQYDNCMHNYHT